MEKSIATHTITNEQLIQTYLTPCMEQYFYKKLKEEYPEYIKIKICELLKYFILCQYSQGPIPFNEELDVLWHLWILQTKQYHELMQKLPAKRYIHHSSNDYNNIGIKTLSDKEEINRQVSFLVSYLYNFGHFDENSVMFWPMAIHVMNLYKFTIKDLNNYLIQLSI